MYESFFGLSEPAFSLTPDPRFLWPSETHQGPPDPIHGISRCTGFLLLTVGSYLRHRIEVAGGAPQEVFGTGAEANGFGREPTRVAA